MLTKLRWLRIPVVPFQRFRRYTPQLCHPSSGSAASLGAQFIIMCYSIACIDIAKMLCSLFLLQTIFWSSHNSRILQTEETTATLCAEPTLLIMFHLPQHIRNLERHWSLSQNSTAKSAIYTTSAHISYLWISYVKQSCCWVKEETLLLATITIMAMC